ncbi:MAG: hypothetical protein ACR2N7_12745 [Acidimicrobiia bacterium]
MVSTQRSTPSEVAGFAGGMVLGAVAGFIIWMATDTFVFFPVFIGIGFVLGMAFAQGTGKTKSNE